MTDTIEHLLHHHVAATFQRDGWQYLGCLGCEWGKDANYSALDHAPHREHLASLIRAEIAWTPVSDVTFDNPVTVQGETR